MNARIVSSALRQLAQTIELTEDNPLLLKSVIQGLHEAHQFMLMKAYHHQQRLIYGAAQGYAPDELRSYR